jgi:hypothetical protein
MIFEIFFEIGHVFFSIFDGHKKICFLKSIKVLLKNYIKFVLLNSYIQSKHDDE